MLVARLYMYVYLAGKLLVSGAAALHVPSAPPGPSTDWFSVAQRGIFTHYLPGLQNNFGYSSQGKNSSWSDCVKEFDVDAYAADVSSTGARYAVFTVMQSDAALIAPNVAFDTYTGFAPGTACSKRDLVLDLHTALAKRNLRLLLYWSCAGPMKNPQAWRGLGFHSSCHSPMKSGSPCAATTGGKSPCSCNMTQQPVYLERWTDVLEEYSQRYGNKVSGWWIDGCYAPGETALGYDFTEATLKPFHDAIRAGNPDALIALNNGVHHPIGQGTPQSPDRVSQWADFTAGESHNLAEIPARRFVTDQKRAASAQWHTLSHLGWNWARAGSCNCSVTTAANCSDPRCGPYTAKAVGEYCSAVARVGGVVSIDVRLLRNGSLDAEQATLLRSAWQAAHLPS